MASILIVDDPRLWPLELPGLEVVAAKEYLTEARWSAARNLKIFNLCRSYRYQGNGYYVSLLAVARGHTPTPSLQTILDMRSRTILGIVDEDLEDTIQRSLARLKSDKFELSIYFGRNLARRYDPLSRRLFAQFHVPLLRATFARSDKWHLTGIAPLSARKIPDGHRPFVIEAAREYFSARRPRGRKTQPSRFDLALLVKPDDTHAPSNEKALKRFIKACDEVDIRVFRITKDDYSSLPEYDALYIRETTQVNHHTYRFAQRAEAEGLVVIDDPQSIIRCTNKVYLAELMQRLKIPTPQTLVGHRENLDEIINQIGLPCVLKSPDSAFSQGVLKARDEEELRAKAMTILQESDLFVAQEFMPTDFDWRVGVLDRQPLWVCRYHMAPGHWQIINAGGKGDDRYGMVDTLAVADAPPRVVRTALKAANAIGSGLYGVDIKESGKRIVVMEVNDNPNIDAGLEDEILGMELHERLAQVFLKRIEAKKAGKTR
ncbi:MAG: RimK family protein [Planctomycetes bacterium]|nr:RimK family protein [Planctomycetota bacterium]